MPTGRLQRLREQRDLSRRRLARELGVHPSTVGRWEAGSQSIPDARKVQLADFFSVSVPYLMGWDQPEDNGNGDNGESEVA